MSVQHIRCSKRTGSVDFKILTGWDEIELLDLNKFWIVFLNDIFLAVFWIVSSAGH